jgi:hypothetical protein
MPHDLRDPEGLFPYHYDERYEKGTNTFEPGSPDVDGYIQTLVFQACGRKLCPELMQELKDMLKDKGFMHQNPGDEPFQKAVVDYVKNLKTARKIARKVLNASQR